MKTNTIKARLAIISLFAMAMLTSGCADLFNGSGSSSSDSDTAYVEPVADYYYGEFDDVPIPKDMKPSKEGYLVSTQGNVKVGLQVFSGRVEINSLNRAISEYMSRDGWTLFSASSGAKQNMLVFNKGDRLCVIITVDGNINTEMRVNVTHKI
ncbi:hypothetical protein LJC48_07765 [Desulfovibrio sp. OttesenSCG-928-C06]|nr:hypothetical protein [Desulfovibrio sp. OttesenSCG-928-C06]